MGFGDFARICPTILTLAIQEKRPIPVFFNFKELGEVFLESPFIEVLKKKPTTPPTFFDTIVSYVNVVFNKHFNKYYGAHNSFHKHENMLPASMGIVKPYGLTCKNPVAVFNGCNVRWAKEGTRYEAQKNILDINRQGVIDALIERDFTPVILGTKIDHERFWSKINLDKCVVLLGKTKFYEAVRAINECIFFVSNDTGLYHHASMMQKPGFVFWSDTHYFLEGNPFDKDYVFHHQGSDKSKYIEAFRSFLDNNTDIYINAKREHERSKYIQIMSTTNYGSSNHGKKAYEMVKSMRPSFIVDFGCGKNTFIKDMKEFGINGVGVDFAAKEADVKRPMHDTLIKPGTADLVTAFDSMEHLLPEEVDDVLNEMKRVAKPSAKFIFSISTVPSNVLVNEENLHPTVREKEWWKNKINRIAIVDQNSQNGYITGKFR